MTKSFRLVTNKTLLVPLIGLVITLVSFWRLWPVFSTHLPSESDGVLISFLISWTGQSFSSGNDPWQVPFFHPYQNTLTFSDPFLISGLLTIPLQLLTTNILLIHNTWLVITALAMWLLMFWFLKIEKATNIGALLAASTFLIAPWHWHYTVHLHTFNQIFLITAVGSFLKWRQTGKSWWLWLTSAALISQLLDSALSAYWIGFLLLVLSNEKAARKQIWSQRATVLRNLLVIGGIGILCYSPFFETSRLYHYTRSIRDAAHFAHSLERLMSWDLAGVGLLCLSLFWWSRSQSQPQRQPHSQLLVSDLTLVIIIGLGIMMMLGPVLKIQDSTFKIVSWPIPLPYAAAYYLVPGFQAFRASSRWIVVAGFGLSWLLGRFWSRVKMPPAFSLLGAIVICTFWWWQGPRQWELYPIPISTPQIYTLTTQTPARNLAEFPVYVWSMHPYVVNETNRLLYQRIHQLKLYNGASGFTPPQAIDDWTALWSTFPNDESLDLLQTAQIDHLIVHFDEYQQMADDRYVFAGTTAPSAAAIQDHISRQSRLGLLGCREQACLYTIRSNDTDQDF